MHYKTIILELIRQRREIHDRLRKDGTLAETLDRYAGELKQAHETWMEEFSRARPGIDPGPMGGEALEMALKEMEDRIGSMLPGDGGEPPSLDDAMAFLRRHTPSE